MAADNLKQRAVSGTFWYGGSRVAIQALTWAITILVARLLTPGDYGLLGFAMLVGGLADLINEFGVGAAIIQRTDLDNEDFSAIFWFSFTFGALIYLVVWLLAPWIATFFKQPALVLVLRISLLNYFINPLRIIQWNLFTKRVEFKHRSLVEFAANIVGALSTLALAYAGCGVWALVWGILIREITLTISCQILRPWWPQTRFAWSRLQKVLGFGLNISAGRVAWYAYSNADFLIVGRLLGQQLFGVYTMVWQLAMLPVDRIANVVNQVAYPVYAELQNQPERFTRYFLNLVKLVSLVTFSILSGVFLVADIAIPLLLTEKWAPIIAPLKIMAWVGMISSVSILIAPAIIAKGRPDLALKYNFACLAILPTGFVIGSRFGIMGVCWAWLALQPLMTSILYTITRKLIGYEWRELFAAFLPATICAVVILVVVSTVRAASSAIAPRLAQLILLISVGVGSYTVVLFIGFRPLLKELWQMFASRNRKPAANL